METNFRSIESKWQSKFISENIFYFDQNSNKPTKYVVEQLYYPSGKLHIGHLRLLTIGDVIARSFKSRGYSVPHPMGADAFGLPAENAAIEKGIHPKKWTYDNIGFMNNQIKDLGASYDWSMTLNTCDVDYIKFEQQVFLDFYQKTLIYQAESLVNWDPVDKTVLSNEQVSDGRGWRSGALVEKRKMTQWFMRITEYAEELLSELKNLQWTPKILKMQENWIGKSEGAEIDFTIINNRSTTAGDNVQIDKITVFTTRPETIFGVVAIAISFEHPIAQLISSSSDNRLIRDFLEECNSGGVAEEELAKRQKKAIEIKMSVQHPFSKELIPVVIANYVMMNYGTGAVMMVPAHDERDFECIRKCFPEIAIKKVIEGEKRSNIKSDTQEICFTEHGELVNSDLITGLHSKDDKDKIINILVKCSNKFRRKTSYRLRDWCISRQRYWGCPIPIIHCDKCGIVPEKKENLPILLPDDSDLIFDGKGNPLEFHPTWKYVKCPKCKSDATRDCNTMDTYVESSWYFLRYLSALDTDSIFNKSLIEKILPVDIYLGGPEHATTHMLYARFFMKAMRDCGYFVDFKGDKACEPFKAFTAIGMVCHKTFQDQNKKYLYPEEVYFKEGYFYSKEDDQKVIIGPSTKMSKSKKNVIEPSHVIEKYGVDTCRFFLMSDNPIDNDFDWTSEGLEACCKYIKKVYNFLINIKSINFAKISDMKTISSLEALISSYIENFEKYSFNVSNAKFREIMSILFTDIESLSFDDCKLILRDVLTLLNPVMPHLTEEIWENLEFNGYISKSSYWPKYKAIEKLPKLSVQINGKFRGFYTLEPESSVSEQDVVKKIQLDLNFIKYLTNKQILKVIYQQNKFINLILD